MLSETDVINAFAQLYVQTRQSVGDEKASVDDCFATAGQSKPVWLVVTCEPEDAGAYHFPVDRLGRLIQAPASAIGSNT